MSAVRKAKLFRNGASQAVRLPAEFRFEGREVYIRRDERTGDVILSQQPGAEGWSEFFSAVAEKPLPASFMADRPLNVVVEPRRIFADDD